MAEPKTQKTSEKPADFIKKISNEETRKDCSALIKIMKEVTGKAPAMWGPSIVGFGSYALTYASGKTAEWPLIGFSPRKQNLTLYVSHRQTDKATFKKLGRHKVSGSCLHIKKLSDVDLDVLKKVIANGYAGMRKKYPK
jgi:hypothetical protein